MKKIILLTGATDGIGLETAKILAAQGHELLIHGRSPEKLEGVKAAIESEYPNTTITSFIADLSDLASVASFVKAIKAKYTHLDVIINNAGIFKTAHPITTAGYDVRFVVNTIAPYVITKGLLPLMNESGRVINLSSAAQAPISFNALRGNQALSDSAAYAQSKLAITMWTLSLAKTVGNQGPSLIAVNPASFLGSKMVKEAYGSNGKDLSIGAQILVDSSISEKFAGITGRYFDNDIGSWSSPHPDALDPIKNEALISAIETFISDLDF